MRYWIESYNQLTGQRFRIFETFRSLQVVRTENEIGALVVTLPLKQYRAEEWWKNQILEVWREKRNINSLMNQTLYFVQDWQIYRSDDGQALVDIFAVDANWILSTRIVDYYAGAPQADKTGPIDNMMKAIVRENFLSLAPTERQLPTLTCTDDIGAAISASKAFSRRNVLTVLRELVDLAKEGGQYLVFDVTKAGPGALIFDTYLGMRGIDHSRDSGVPRFVGEKYGNLISPLLRFEYSDECTVAIAGGQGEGPDRVIKRARDDIRIERGAPYNWIERFKDARQDASETGVQAEADSELTEGRPRRIISGRLIDTPMMGYGFEFDFGDIVTVEAFGQSVDCHISSVAISVTQAEGEQIEIVLRSEDESG